MQTATLQQLINAHSTGNTINGIEPTQFRGAQGDSFDGSYQDLSADELESVANDDYFYGGYYQAGISTHHAGFGMYEENHESQHADLWLDESVLLQEIKANLAQEIDDFELYELGVDQLPEGLEDIRGRINYEKGRIFGYLRPNRTVAGVVDEEEGYSSNYFAIVEK